MDEETPFALDPAALAAALGARVAVHRRPGEPPIYRFSQPVAFADGLNRHNYLDLGARRFRSTLWAGPHRCLDHVELASLQRVTCDAAGGRVLLDAVGVRLVLTRQGALSIVPLDRRRRAHQRRSSDTPTEL